MPYIFISFPCLRLMKIYRDGFTHVRICKITACPACAVHDLLIARWNFFCQGSLCRGPATAENPAGPEKFRRRLRYEMQA